MREGRGGAHTCVRGERWGTRVRGERWGRGGVGHMCERGEDWTKI